MMPYIIQFVVCVFAYLAAISLYNLIYPNSENAIAQRIKKHNRQYAACCFRSEVVCVLTLKLYIQLSIDMKLGMVKTQSEYQKEYDYLASLVPSIEKLAFVDLPLTYKNFLPDELREFIEVKPSL